MSEISMREDRRASKKEAVSRRGCNENSEKTYLGIARKEVELDGGCVLVVGFSGAQPDGLLIVFDDALHHAGGLEELETVVGESGRSALARGEAADGEVLAGRVDRERERERRHDLRGGDALAEASRQLAHDELRAVVPTASTLQLGSVSFPVVAQDERGEPVRTELVIFALHALASPVGAETVLEGLLVEPETFQSNGFDGGDNFAGEIIFAEAGQVGFDLGLCFGTIVIDGDVERKGTQDAGVRHGLH